MAMKMISTSKLSKKAKRRMNLERRVTWGFSPVSRVNPDKKEYKRRKDTRQDLET